MQLEAKEFGDCQYFSECEISRGNLRWVLGPEKFRKSWLHFLNSITHHRQMETLLSMIIWDKQVDILQTLCRPRRNQAHHAEHYMQSTWHSGKADLSGMVYSFRLWYRLQWTWGRGRCNQCNSSQHYQWQLFLIKEQLPCCWLSKVANYHPWLVYVFLSFLQYCVVFSLSSVVYLCQIQLSHVIFL